MRSVWLVAVVALFGCGPPRNVRTSQAPPVASDRVAPVEAAPRTIHVGELGAEGVNAEWIELQMPPDARVLAFERKAESFRETWTLVEGNTKRLLRVRLEDGTDVGQAAWVGTTTKDGMDLRLVEVRGKVRFAPERLTVTCAKDKICKDGEPRREITASMCVFEDGAVSREVAWFLPGKGVDFPIGRCEVENTTRERYLKGPLGKPSPGS